MRVTSLAKATAAAIVVSAALSPAMAKMKEPNACAAAEMRCTAAPTCDKEGWCKVYGCIGTQTVLLPFACNEKAGGCLQKRCS